MNEIPPSSSQSEEESSDISAASLSDHKLRLESQKLELEIEQLKRKAAESQRTYLWRNPQVIPTGIAAIGAIVGLGVGLYSGYFSAMKEKADLDHQVAAIEKTAAVKEAADAKTAKDRADQTQKEATAALGNAQDKMAIAQDKQTKADARMGLAEETQKKGDAIIATEQKKIDDAKERYVVARHRADQAEEENRAAARYIHDINKPAFDLTGLPDFIYRHQDQLRRLRLVNINAMRVGSLPQPAVLNQRWITDPQLEKLTVGWEGLDLASLRTIKPSIKELGIEAFIHTNVDLRVLSGIGSLRKFTLWVSADDQNHPPEIRNLGLAENLESLEIRVNGSRLIGIEDILQLSRLKNLSLSFDGPSDIPQAILNKVTALSFSGARPIDPAPLTHAQFASLAANQHLATLSLPGQIDRADWGVLSRSGSLRELLAPNTKLTIDPGVTFPKVTALLVSLENPTDSGKIFSAFPNLRDLSLMLESSFKEADNLEPLLDDIARRYPLLHSLTITNSLNIDKPRQYSFPRMPVLQTIRLEFNSLDASHAVTVNLDPEKLPSLRSLVVNCGALRPGQLSRLPHLESLILNDFSPEVPSGLLDEVQKLAHLRVLGLTSSSPMPKGAVQRILDIVPIRELILVDRSLILDVDHLPNTVESLDLGGGGFLRLGMDWYLLSYFSDTYQ